MCTSTVYNGRGLSLSRKRLSTLTDRLDMAFIVWTGLSVKLYPRMPDYTLYSGVYVCWSEHSDSSFVYGFMTLDYGLCTMTTTTI